MDCLASLPKIKETGCKCVTFRAGTIIFSVLHLVFYITVGAFLYDLDPSEYLSYLCECKNTLIFLYRHELPSCLYIYNG